MTNTSGDSLTRIAEWHEPLMGTAVELQLVLDGEDQEERGQSYTSAVIEEMVRLQNVLSSVDASSEFSRWSRGEVAKASSELFEVLTETAYWQSVSGGRFNPATAALSTLWKDAEMSGVIPAAQDAQAIADAIAAPRWKVRDGRVLEQLGDCTHSTLNAFAKGWIVDRAISMLMTFDGVRSATVNAGGDLRRSGVDSLLVGIENPHRPFDNEPPLTAVSVQNASLATSGSARKGFQIGDRHFGHVIDPRTGWPVESIASISVVADTAATADVLATILGVQEPIEAIAEAEDRNTAVFIVDSEGNQFRSEAWTQIEVPIN